MLKQRKSITVPFLDYTLNEMKTRFTDLHARYALELQLVPSIIENIAPQLSPPPPSTKSLDPPLWRVEVIEAGSAVRYRQWPLRPTKLVWLRILFVKMPIPRQEIEWILELQCCIFFHSIIRQNFMQFRYAQIS